MSNMSYCRFENTALDLADCVLHWNDLEEASDYELNARKTIIELARDIVNMESDNEEVIK